MCEARDELTEAVDGLRDVSLSDDGIESLESAIADVSDRLGDVRSAASAEIGPEPDPVDDRIGRRC